MKSDFFIDRPIFSTVVSIVIVIVGTLGLLLLPVDPPFWTDWVANGILDWCLAAPAGLR